MWGYEPVVSPAERSFIVSRKEVITTGFAGIFSNNVIEHLLRPVDEFRYFHRIMAPGGLMAHASPCYQVPAMSSHASTWSSSWVTRHTFSPSGRGSV